MSWKGSYFFAKSTVACKASRLLWMSDMRKYRIDASGRALFVKYERFVTDLNLVVVLELDLADSFAAHLDGTQAGKLLQQDPAAFHHDACVLPSNEHAFDADIGTFVRADGDAVFAYFDHAFAGCITRHQARTAHCRHQSGGVDVYALALGCGHGSRRALGTRGPVHRRRRHRAARKNHGLVEAVFFFFLDHRVTGRNAEQNCVFGDGDLVAVGEAPARRDALAVDLGAVQAVAVLDEVIAFFFFDNRVQTRDREVVDHDV